MLDPPLPATIFCKLGLGLTQVVRFELVAVAAHESFHGTSWIYPSADSFFPSVELFAFQKPPLICVPTSSKSVPPTAMLNGVDAIPLTASPPAAAVAVLKSSHPAVPLSPAETVTVMPWAAACSHRVLRNVLAVAPRPDSHTPKLRLITSSELLSTTYSAPRNSGSEVSVPSELM